MAVYIRRTAYCTVALSAAFVLWAWLWSSWYLDTRKNDLCWIFTNAPAQHCR